MLAGVAASAAIRGQVSFGRNRIAGTRSTMFIGSSSFVDLGVQVIGAAAEPALDVALGRVRIMLQQPFGGGTRGGDEHLVVQRIGEAEQRRAGLSCAEELPRTADREVAASDLEAVVGLEHRLESRLRGVGERRAVEQ